MQARGLGRICLLNAFSSSFPSTIRRGQSRPPPPPHPSEGPPRATPAPVQRQVNPSAAGSSGVGTHAKVGQAATWLARSPRRLLGREPPPKLGAEFGGEAPVPKAPGLRSRAGRAHPPGREPQVSDEPPLPQERARRARGGAAGCGRGPGARGRPAKGPEKDAKPPATTPQPAARRLGDGRPPPGAAVSSPETVITAIIPHLRNSVSKLLPGLRAGR